MQTLKLVCDKIFENTSDKNRKIIFNISTFISTGCLVGKIKYAPGTFGSLLAILLCIPFIYANIYVQLIILSLLFILGCFSTYFYLLKINDLTKDPKEVVIDEIFAVFFITFLSQIVTTNFKWYNFATIFVLFRIFDIIKPYPISYVDKNIKGVKGIMFDDILAGVASFLVYILIYF